MRKKITFEEISEQISEVENTLADHSKDIHNHDKRLSTLSYELNSHYSELSGRLKLIEESLTKREKSESDIDKHLKKLSNFIDEMNNIQLNGTKGVPAALHTLYKATEPLRKKRKLMIVLKEYLGTNLIGKFALTVPGTMIFILLNIFVLLSVLHAFGVPVDPIQVIRFFISPIMKLF